MGLERLKIERFMDKIAINTPELWHEHLPKHPKNCNKYDKGHLVVAGGGIECTGAACLAATAGLRAGAGLVTVLSPKDALEVYATKLTSVMAKPYKNLDSFEEFLSDKRINAVLLGPGNGVSGKTRKKVSIALKLGKACVIDADAITSFAGKAEELFKEINSPVIFTPHEGEFARLFSGSGDRQTKAAQAAKECNAVVVLKGAETIIASPCGKIAINKNAPQTLATAGTGDVLAGIIAGLLAQKMEAFYAACAGVWLHSQAAKLAGPALIAEDLPGFLGKVLKEL